MNRILNLKEITELFKSEKAVKIILVSGAVIIILIALSGFNTGESEISTDSDLFSYDSQSEYEALLESRLSEILSHIEGIGNLNVMVTLETSEKNEYLKSGDSPVFIETPKIRGVIVVCEGGNNVIVREKVISAVSGVFGINSTHISVIK